MCIKIRLTSSPKPRLLLTRVSSPALKIMQMLLCSKKNFSLPPVADQAISLILKYIVFVSCEDSEHQAMNWSSPFKSVLIRETKCGWFSV